MAYRLFVVVRQLSLVEAKGVGGTVLLVVWRLLIAVPSLVAEHGL